MPRLKAPHLEEHNRKTWLLIADALDRLLSANVAANVTLAQIAAEAGLARNTLYNYAPDKWVLISAAAEFVAAELEGHLKSLTQDDDDCVRQLKTFVAVVLEWFGSQEGHYNLLAQGLLVASPSGNGVVPVEGPATRLLRWVRDLICRGTSTGAFAPVADHDLAAELLVAVLERGVRRLIANDDVETTTKGVTQNVLRSMECHA